MTALYVVLKVAVLLAIIIVPLFGPKTEKNGAINNRAK